MSEQDNDYEMRPLWWARAQATRMYTPGLFYSASGVVERMRAEMVKFNQLLADVDRQADGPLTGVHTTAPIALRCECGSAACGSAAHSDWCPMHGGDL